MSRCLIHVYPSRTARFCADCRRVMLVWWLRNPWQVPLHTIYFLRDMGL